MAKEVIEIEVKTGKAVQNTDKLKKSVKGVNEEMTKASDNSEQIQENINKISGGRLQALKGTLTSVTKGFKNLKVAIISSGVGALALAIFSVIRAFKDSEEGQNKFTKLMGQIGVVIGNVMDIIADFGEAIISAFEEPEKAWNSFVDSMKTGWKFVKGQVIDRFKANWSILSGAFESAVLKMRIAWNDFTGDSEEADQLREQLEGVNKEILNSIDVIKKRNQEVIDLYDKATGKVKEFIQANKEETKQAGQVADMRAKADKIERNLLIERAKLENEIAELKLKSREEDRFSAEERKKALLEAQDLEDELLRKETVALQLRADAQTLENTFSRSNKENLDAEAEAIAKVIRQQAMRTNAQRQTQRELNRLNREIEAENKRLEKEQSDKDKTAEASRQKEIDDAKKFELDKLKLIQQAVNEFNRAKEDREAETEIQKLELQRERQLAKLDLLVEGLNQETEAYRLAEEQRRNYVLESEKLIQEQKKKDKKQELIQEQALQQQKVAIVGQTFGAIAGILGTNSRLGKASAIAQATINTYQGITEVWSNKSTLPEPFATISKVASTATVLASGLKAVKSIKSQKLPSNSAGGGGGGGVQPAPAPAQAQFNVVGASPINQLAQTIGEQTTQPQQAFVVSGEVTTAQELEEGIIDSASIGG